MAKEEKQDQIEEEYSYELKIPRERIAVLIGKKGEIKEEIEKTTKIQIAVDSKEGDVFLKGKDSYALFNVKMIIQAIARGFNPEIALRLLKIDYAFEIINIMDYAKTKKSMMRLKGRIIGKDGRSRANLEQLTDTNISVYGKTVSVIGKAEDVVIARKALENLLEGSPHSTVYKWLERQKNKQMAEHAL